MDYGRVEEVTAKYSGKEMHLKPIGVFMKLFEYEAKSIAQNLGINIPKGSLLTFLDTHHQYSVASRR